MGYIGNGPYQGSITGGNIQDGTVDTDDLKDSAVTTDKIADAAVSAAKLAAGAAVPTQTGQAGKYLTTDGTTSSWGTVNTDLVSDSSPQLGGDLDGQSYKITTDGNIGVGSGATQGGVSVYRNNHSTSHSNPHIFLRNGNNTTGDKALITTGFTADLGAGFTPVAFGGLNVNAASGVRDGAFAVYVADADNVDLATDERMRVTESGVDVTGTVTADEFDPSGFPSGTVVQKQHWVLSTHTNTASNGTWMEFTSGSRPSITPVHSNSKFIIECFANHWGDIDNDGQGYVNARVELQKIVGGSYNSSLYDKTSLIDRGGQSRTRHQVIVEADNSISQGTTYEYQLWAQCVTSSNGRSHNINTVPSYIVISEVVN